MTKFFDGKAFAKRRENRLKKKVNDLRKKGIVPKLVSIVIGDDTDSIFYQNLKKRAAARIGAVLEIKNLDNRVNQEEVIKTINELNKNYSICGIMIQLPLPMKFSHRDRNKFIDCIYPQKDVDGLREDSPFIAPVVNAVMSAIPGIDLLLKSVVLGSGGFEGKKIVKRMKQLGYKKLFEIEKTGSNNEKIIKYADLIISSTGQPDLIKPSMIKDGVFLIDVGSPKGDISKDCYEKASYVSPVPGGIGPVTISYLMENLVESAKKVASN